MKKMLKGIATLIALVALVFGGMKTAHADNAERASNKEARAVRIKAKDENGNPVPLYSYGSELEIYLLPGEEWTMPIPTIPGYTATSIRWEVVESTDVTEYKPDSIRLVYDNIPAPNTLFSGGASHSIEPTWEIELIFSLNEGAERFYGVPVHGDESFSAGDSTDEVFSRYGNRNLSGYPFDYYTVYIRNGDTFPLKSRTANTSSFHGFVYMRDSYGGGVSDVFKTNQIVDLSQHDISDFVGLTTEIIAMYGNEDSSTATISDGYWESFPLASIPGNENYVNGEDMPEGTQTFEEVEETEESSTENPPAYTEESQNSNDGSGATALLFVGGAVGAIIYFAKKGKKDNQ